MTRTDYRLLALSALMVTSLTLPAHAEDSPSVKAAPTIAQGEPHPEGHEGGPDGKGPHRGAERFKRADTNNDGFLTKEEMTAEHQKRLDKMFIEADTNKDSKLSPEEMKKSRDAMRAKWKAKREEWKAQKGEKGSGDKVPLEGKGSDE